MKISSIKRDTTREDQGDWVSIPSMPGVSLKVRSQQVPDFRNPLNARMGKLRRNYGNEPIPVEVSERVTGEMIADKLWLDADGLEDDDGNPLQLDTETKRTVMTSPEYRDLADAVTWATQRVGESDRENLEADQGNSATGTSGTRSSATGKAASGS